MAGAGTSDVGLYVGGFIIPRFGAYDNVNRTWGAAINGGLSFDTTRRNHVLYETPTLAGFTVQAAVAEDNFWDVALRYAGEFGGFRLAFGIGYMEDTEFNGAAGALTCTTDCARKESELKGSASVLHVATGLFVTAAAGQRDVENFTSHFDLQNVNHDENFWYVAAGVRKNFFGFGDTVLFGEYSEHDGFLKRASPGVVNIADSKVTHWGVGVNQYIDAAAMEVFLTYKHFELDETLIVGGAFPGLHDMQVIVGGARINF
jgi:hypothetical protein